VASVEAPRTRRSFARLNKVLEVPNLIDIQRKSFAWLTDPQKGGLRETIDDISPIEDYTGNLAVDFGELSFDAPTAPIDECREKDLTYARPLSLKVAFVNRETGEIREQSVFMGDFPWMTDWGTFIINGTERVVVTQLVRSPGAYLMEPKDREKQVFIANLMPARGSWLELEIDKKGRVFVRIDRKRQHAGGRPSAPPDRGRRAHRAVQEAAARGAAERRERQGPAPSAVLRPEALRPDEGRPLQAELPARRRRRSRHPGAHP
jgi:DNA-directed RNA polymerase subunit beta